MLYKNVINNITMLVEIILKLSIYYCSFYLFQKVYNENNYKINFHVVMKIRQSIFFIYIYFLFVVLNIHSTIFSVDLVIHHNCYT